VRKLLREAGLGPAGKRAGLTWREFIRHQAATTIACDFFTVDTVRSTRLYVLFFIELASRRVHLAGCSQNPSGAWVAQQARNLAWSFDERASLRFLIHDRDSKFTDAFDEVFRSQGIEVIRTPFKAPQANAFAVGTIRRECLDWVLIFGHRQLERVLGVYVEHYNGHRPHRALGRRRSPDQTSASLLRAGSIASAGRIDSADWFTSTARPREGDRVRTPQRPPSRLSATCARPNVAFDPPLPRSDSWASFGVPSSREAQALNEAETTMSSSTSASSRAAPFPSKWKTTSPGER
jgi:Integrase core domain